MADKEVKVGDKVIGENTKISLSVKTALWIIGSIIALFSTVFTIAYFDVKDDVKDYKEQVDEDKSEFIQTVEDKLDEKLGKFQENDEKFIEDIGDIKGDIKVILDRTGGRVRNNNNSHLENTENRPPTL